MDIKTFADSVQRETEKIILGKSDAVRLVIMAVLADGHVLLDDLPGVGKTTLIKTLSRALNCGFNRIQFVPDLMPGDILGMNIFNQRTGDFELRTGPVMTNLLLADEINRAIPRTQSALLEAMEERQITIDGRSINLPRPFLVLATQNPVESESTFRLPAAQMDRFLIRISIGYPDENAEKQMLINLGDSVDFSIVKPVADVGTIISLQQEAWNVHVSDAVLSYIVSLCQATRNHPALSLGASPRGSRTLYKAGKVWAAMNGRDYVLPDDIQTLVAPVLSHRLQLTAEARFSGRTPERIIEEILRDVPVPDNAKEKLYEL